MIGRVGSAATSRGVIIAIIAVLTCSLVPGGNRSPDTAPLPNRVAVEPTNFSLLSKQGAILRF
jgi:hypothetical protein